MTSQEGFYYLIFVSLPYFMLKLLWCRCVGEEYLVEYIAYSRSAVFRKLCQNVLDRHIHLKIMIC